MSDAAAVFSLFEPNGSDWLVSLVLDDGTIVNRRFSPGSMTEQQALAMALHIARVSPERCKDAIVQRVGQAKVIEAAPDDHFERLMRRVRR
jgi:hypothetical protein